MTCSWVCIWPHGQRSESVMPHLFKLASWVHQGFLGRLLPGEDEVFKLINMGQNRDLQHGSSRSYRPATTAPQYIKH